MSGTLKNIEFIQSIFGTHLLLYYKSERKVASMYICYFDEEKCILYKSTGGAFDEEYIENAEWNTVGNYRIEGLEPISEEEADNIIKEIEGDEYDLVDGYVLVDYKGEDQK